jgi:hypothetical protein
MCCGNKRTALTRAAPFAATGLARAAAPLPPPPRRSASSVIVFEYTGVVPATVTGPATGRAYRFARPGDKLAVDVRDRAGLLNVAGLRRVR